jgi:hypothetical protein
MTTSRTRDRSGAEQIWIEFAVDMLPADLDLPLFALTNDDPPLSHALSSTANQLTEALTSWFVRVCHRRKAKRSQVNGLLPQAENWRAMPRQHAS